MANTIARPLPKRRITFRRVTIEHVGDRNEPVVFCPRKLAAISVVSCRRCERFSGLCVNPSQGDSFLRCAFGDEEPVGSDAQQNVAETLSVGVVRAPISEIMTAPVQCARPDATLEDLAAMFLAEHISAIPVIDVTGRPVGIVSKTDAMERYYDQAEDAIFAEAVEMIEHTDAPETEQSEVVALDIMTRAVFSVAAETSISHVAAIMAYERIHHVLIASADAEVLGIVSTFDMVHWLARAGGYVVPRRPREPQDS